MVEDDLLIIFIACVAGFLVAIGTWQVLNIRQETRIETLEKTCRAVN